MADPNDPWADDARPDAYDDAPAGHDPHAGDGPHADLGTYASDREVEAENPKKGLGTGVKVLVGLLVAGFGAAVLCCGVGIFAAVNGTETDRTPAGVRQKTEEILAIDLPDRFAPEQATRMDLPVLNLVYDRPVDAAEYSTPGGGRLYLAKNGNVGDEPGVGDALKTATELQLQMTGAEAFGRQVTDSETRELVTADGRTVKWRFAATEPAADAENAGDPQAGPFRRVFGVIPDGRDVYVLQLAVPESEYDEAEIVAMLESIELVDPRTEPIPPGDDLPLEDPAADVDGDPTDLEME